MLPPTAQRLADPVTGEANRGVNRVRQNNFRNLLRLGSGLIYFAFRFPEIGERTV